MVSKDMSKSNFQIQNGKKSDFRIQNGKKSDFKTMILILNLESLIKEFPLRMLHMIIKEDS